MKRKLRFIRMPAFLVVFVVVAVLAVLFARAATTSQSFEAEDGTLNGPAVIRNVSGASGGALLEFTVTCEGEDIAAGADIQAAVTANPAGTTFCLADGIYRNQSVTPRAGNTFIGQSGTILSGAKLITSAMVTQEGQHYVVSNQTQEGPRVLRNDVDKPTCMSDSPRCYFPEDLYIDDELQTHVGSLAQVDQPDEWFFDYGADKIYFFAHARTNPANHKVETSSTTYAIRGAVSNVTIRNITVEKYASPSQGGPIYADGGDGWVVDAVVSRWNHAAGILFRDSNASNPNDPNTVSKIMNSTFLYNGQTGIKLRLGVGTIVENNEIAYNLTGGYLHEWEGGGTKFGSTTDVIVRNNFTHHNHGPGMWSDVNCFNTTYDGNLIEDNGFAGIFYEVSYGAVIKNNTIRRNALNDFAWGGGGGIQIAASTGVEVFNNLLEDNARGITVIQQNRPDPEPPSPDMPHIVQNLYVHDNRINMLEGPADRFTGFVTDIRDGNGDLIMEPFRSRNNRFENNTYYVPNTTGRWWHWEGGTKDWSAWQGFGLDEPGGKRLTAVDY